MIKKKGKGKINKILLKLYKICKNHGLSYEKVILFIKIIIFRFCNKKKVRKKNCKLNLLKLMLKNFIKSFLSYVK